MNEGLEEVSVRVSTSGVDCALIVMTLNCPGSDISTGIVRLSSYISDSTVVASVVAG